MNAMHYRRGISGALESIDRQVPSLTYFGLAFWMAWNAIAFSGSFWLHDTESSIRTENLILVHLITSVVTLIALSLLSKFTTHFIAKNWFTLIGGCVAFAGSLFIVITRESIYPSQILFNIGCIFSGAGTTVLFMRAAILFGALKPKRSIIMLAGCCIVASTIYLILNNFNDETASIIFVILPLVSVAFYCLRGKRATPIESKVLHSQKSLSRTSYQFLLSVVLCSAAFEIARSLIVVSIPPSYSTQSTTIARVIAAVVMMIIILIALLTKGRYRYGTVYSIFTFFLVVVLIIIVMIPYDTVTVVTFVQAICECYNITIWAMLAYIVFQAESSAIKIFGWGNAALSLGTIIGGALVQANYLYSILTPDQSRIVLLVLGIIVLVDLIFAFSDKQINRLLKPIDPERLEEKQENEKHPRQWVLACEAVAEEYHLSERETEVFVMLARGRSPQEIADSEVLSIYTIRAHIRSIYAKLDIHSKNELVKFVEDRTSKS